MASESDSKPHYVIGGTAGAVVGGTAAATANNHAAVSFISNAYTDVETASKKAQALQEEYAGLSIKAKQSGHWAEVSEFLKTHFGEKHPLAAEFHATPSDFEAFQHKVSAALLDKHMATAEETIKKSGKFVRMMAENPRTVIAGGAVVGLIAGLSAAAHLGKKSFQERELERAAAQTEKPGRQ